MTRTLLAFGDSHTAGAEIEEQYNYECYSKAYPSYVAKYYGFEYKNYSQAGCSNDWLLKIFTDEIKKVILNEEKVFVLFNFTDSTRTYIYPPYTPNSKRNWNERYYDNLNYYLGHLKENSFINHPRNVYEKELKLYLPIYRHYIASHTNKMLDEKSINQMFIVQTICQKYNIPFIFHNSIQWYSRDWSLIDKKNHFGHHKNSTFNYSKIDSVSMESLYSFWGIATSHPNWKHFQYQNRWHGHYPEEYHKYYASLLIKFIDEQEILEGYI